MPVFKNKKYKKKTKTKPMGISGFFKTLVNTVGEYANKMIVELGVDVKLTDLAGKTICFDASNMIYAAILALSHVKGMTDANGKITSHIKTIMAQVLMFKKAGISQIWIFDNPAPVPLKNVALAKRAKKREVESTAAAPSDKIMFKMTSEHIEDIKKLLGYLGIIYIIAPPGIEAEQYGAYLTIPKPGLGAICEYMYSGDADVLVFGGNLLRPMKTGKSKKIYKAYTQRRVLDALDLTREQLATMAVGLGCDFAEKVKGVGQRGAAKLARTDDIFLSDEQRAARDYFLLDLSTYQVEPIHHQPDQEALVTWLVSLGFNKGVPPPQPPTF